MTDQVIQFTVNVPVETWQEGEWWFARCHALDLTDQGKSQQEARSNLVEAIQVFVETSYFEGSLERLLQAGGYTPQHVDLVQVHDDNRMDVPLSLIAKNVAQARAH